MQIHLKDQYICRAVPAIAIVVGLVASGCDHDATANAVVLQAAVAKATAECVPVKDDLAKEKQALDLARADLVKAKAELAAVQQENVKLKQTARFFFDQAVSKMAASKTDAGDQDATAAFNVVVDRFPSDSLAADAKTKVAELAARVTGRAKALVQAQADVRKLIQVCTSNAHQGQRISREGLVFNENNNINLNNALGASDRAHPYEKRAQAAKEKAELLLKGVPDPDGKLADQLRRCDDYND